MKVGGFVVEAELDGGQAAEVGSGVSLVVEGGKAPMIIGTENGEPVEEGAPYLPPAHLCLLHLPEIEAVAANCGN